MIKRVLLVVICIMASLTVSLAKGKNSLRVMSYNIRIGMGFDMQTDLLNEVGDVIAKINPDFVGLQEVDSVAERSLWVDQMSELAKKTNMYPVFAPATERSKGLYGIGALCKEAPLTCRNIPLPGAEEPRAFLLLEFKDYVLCNTHLSLDEESRLKSIELITEVAKSYNKPLLITGDFNMIPNSKEFNRMCEDWQLLSNPSIKTFPSNRPEERLDYIFGSKGFTFNVHKDMVIDVMASDHLPIYLDITLSSKPSIH